MATPRIFPFPIAAMLPRRQWLFAVFLALGISQGRTQTGNPGPRETAPVTLDRVVAVVNHKAILASDIEDEIQLSVLDPSRAGLGELTAPRALQQLISRSLIEQQIHQDDIPSEQPSEEEVVARLKAIRTQLPTCVRHNCSSDAGWNAFLASHGLTQERVQIYLRNRLEVLRFIELRFRQGIRISPEEISAYYREKLLPLYPAGQTVPPLDQVAPRIQEILLQQQVNTLFDGWLDNLRKQGEIEVLDPALDDPEKPTHPGTMAQ